MKKTAVLLAIMMTSTLIFAQVQKRDSHSIGAKRSERLKKELSLTDDQAGKIKDIRVKYAERQASIRRDSALTQGAARSQQKKLRAEQQAELKGVLTPEQWTKFVAMKESRAKHHKGRFHRG